MMSDDRRLRELERRAVAGDVEAENRLHDARINRELCVTCGCHRDRPGAQCWPCSIGGLADAPALLLHGKTGDGTHILQASTHILTQRFGITRTICKTVHNASDAAAGFAREVTCARCRHEVLRNLGQTVGVSDGLGGSVEIPYEHALRDVMMHSLLTWGGADAGRGEPRGVGEGQGRACGADGAD